MADEMNDAQLHLRFRENRFDRFGKAFESVNAGDENVLNSTVLEFRDDLHPELRALVVGCPDAQNFLEAR